MSPRPALQRRRAAGPARALLLALAIAAGTVPLLSHEGVAAAKLSSKDALGVASGELDGVERDLPGVLSLKGKSGIEFRSAEQMLADGELLVRLRDYSRAILVFSQVEEKYSGNKRAYAEAVFRNGEAFYAIHDYLSARTKFRQIADGASLPEYRAYASRAVARLVDIVVRIEDPTDPKVSEDVLGRISKLAPGDVDSVVLYAKGKMLFFKGDLEGSKTTLGQVGPDGGFQHQARFLLGVIAIKQAQPKKFNPAIDAFKKVTDLPGDTDDHKEVVDLAWIAIGRLFYEMDQLDQSVLAYEHVDRTSKHFDTMLYEIAWVYVRLEDQEKATRALDLLELSSPDSQHAIEGELLKADIQLRKAEFKKALAAYENVRNEIDPLHKRIDDYLKVDRAPGEYYDRLTAPTMDALDGPDSLPPLVIKWAKQGQDGALAFNVVESVQQTKELLQQSQAMLDKLQAVVKGSDQIRAFPEAKAAYEGLIGLLNRIANSRSDVAQGLDEVEPSDLSKWPELEQAREARKRLEGEIAALPKDADAFQKREDEANTQWRAVSQQLQQRNVEIDMLQAQVNALRKYVKTQKDDQGKPLEPAKVREYEQQLDESEKEIVGFKKEAQDLRELIERGRVQAGTGDDRSKADDDRRKNYRDILEKEVRLARQNLGGAAATYAGNAEPVLTRARQVEEKVDKQKVALDAQVFDTVDKLQKTLDAEQAALDGYKKELAAFDSEARDVVGKVAKQNLEAVRKKLGDYMMRAEVGIVDQAWKEREVRKAIVRDRKREYIEQERLLDDEMKQIKSDGSIGIE
jgi:hypothetical protein